MLRFIELHVSCAVEHKLIPVQFLESIAFLDIDHALDFALAMRLPVAHTNPAEFVFAHPTRHMVASLILLDIDVALGTPLCVFLDILLRQPLVHNLFSPFRHFVTFQWPVADVLAALAHPTGARFSAGYKGLFIAGYFDVVSAIPALDVAVGDTLAVEHTDLLLVPLQQVGRDPRGIDDGVAHLHRAPQEYGPRLHLVPDVLV